MTEGSGKLNLKNSMKFVKMEQDKNLDDIKESRITKGGAFNSSRSNVEMENIRPQASTPTEKN